MKTIQVSGAYGERVLDFEPGEEIQMRATGLFAVTELCVRNWHEGDGSAIVEIVHRHRCELEVRLDQLAKRPRWPTLLFFEDPVLTFAVLGAEHRVVIEIHHEAILP